MVNSNPQHNQQAPEKDVEMKDCPDQAVLWACLWGTVSIALTAVEMALFPGWGPWTVCRQRKLAEC